MDTKTCPKCETEKSREHFHIHKNRSDGLSVWCKQCQSIYSKAHRSKNHERLREQEEQWKKNNPNYCKDYYKKHKSEILTAVQSRRENNRAEINRKQKERRLENPEKYNKDQKLWRDSHPENVKRHKENNKSRSAEYVRMRRSSDLNFKIKSRLRSRFCKAVGGNYKAGSAVDDLGCSVEEFKQHVESIWESGMTWENWGKGEGKWQFHHIRPLSEFDLTNPDHVKAACHYTNLKPVWDVEHKRPHGRRSKIKS